MLLSRFFGRRNVPANSSAIRRPQPRRRPLVEGLEGRQLLSGIIGNHIGVTAEGIIGNHIGVTAEVSRPVAPAGFLNQKNFYPAVAEATGKHLSMGTAVSSPVVTSGIVGQHIGVTAEGIVGNHIGVTAEGIIGNHIGVTAEVSTPVAPAVRVPQHIG